MGHGESNGHVTDDVTLPRKANVVTPLCLMPIIPKTAGDADLVRQSCIVSHIENSKNDKGCITKQHVDILSRCSK